MNRKPTSPLAIFATAAAAGLLAALVCGAAGLPVTAKLAGRASMPAVAAGTAVSLVAHWIGLLPVVFLLGPRPEKLLAGLLGGMSVRFFLTLLLALPLALTGWLPAAPFLVWVAVSYLVILLADTTVLALFHRKLDAAGT